jgi:glutamine synthetase
MARPTVEYRSPDGSAYAHLLLAAVTTAVEAGLADPRAAERARRLEVDGSAEEVAELAQLPASAVAAADELAAERGFFEQRGFPPRLLDLVLAKLRAENDDGLSARLARLPAAERLRESRRLMHKDLHKH